MDGPGTSLLGPPTSSPDRLWKKSNDLCQENDKELKVLL